MQSVLGIQEVYELCLITIHKVLTLWPVVDFNLTELEIVSLMLSLWFTTKFN